ncbi:MAG: response regulator transcription factor, partial [Gemmatimonadales bacterium]
GGVLIVLLRVIEYRYLVIEHSLEIYGGLVALIFAVLGIWLGLKFTRPPLMVVREVPVPFPVPASESFVLNTTVQESLGITKRELEILGFIAEGLSTKEIAERAFVSENTVKTHTSRLFDKLGANRRIQAVQVARDRGLIA